ncbi:MAG: formate--tetrahydrofolate ligase [Candidatus Altiarchaeota archaeon]
MKSDLDVERSIRLKPIVEIAREVGLGESDLELYGKYKAKVSFRLLERLRKKKDGRLILVTCMTPTAGGEGKTTVTIGLAQALRKLGRKSFICIREPSLGPCFGMKGGATGGGYSQVVPMEDINLSFTGDIPAVTAANNLLSAIVDNHIYHGNKLNIDSNRIVWKRAVDMNDRSLRKVMIGIGGNGISRDDSFVITAASEVMAVLCLSESMADLKKRLGEMIVAYNQFGKPLRVKQFGVQGAMAALLKNAINPNLVQSIEGCPAFIHGGPFANIAHGSNSILATKMALKLSDYVITEAGFGADLGAEKFFDITCRIGKLNPNAVVLIATVRALRMHGGSSPLKPSLSAVKKGFGNLEKQIENVQAYGIPMVVALNKFQGDTPQELKWIAEACGRMKVKAITVEVHGKGGRGGLKLAEEVLKLAGSKKRLQYLYPENLSLKHKIEIISKSIYGAKEVVYTKKADDQIKHLEQEGLGRLLVCMAKTQKSLSDNPELLGRPRDFTLTVTGVKPSTGAGFIVAFAGNIMLLPGLPEKPNALNIDVNNKGGIMGLF